ncbi:MAG: adenosylcobalamin-dependent ribonucleoside-diphosphate reductase [Pseudomonadota bacterium]
MFDVDITRENKTSFAQPIAENIWRAKYQYQTASGAIDQTLEDTWRRIADGLSEVEPEDNRKNVANEIFDAISGFQLLPAGRILAGCGTTRNVTLSNTFVMRTIPDTVSGIMDTIKEAALTMQMGGGLGYDFSTIRPRGALVRGLDCPAAGPVAAMEICDAVCKMLVTGMGRGAMMGTMRCDHPDIEDFVIAKSDRSRLRNFNLSVMITDAFMEAVKADGPWDLRWDGVVTRTIPAKGLWEKIMRQNYVAAEPGVLFIDRINDLNPMRYAETISATNSCAEQPLPPFGTCPLASINLAQLVAAPFTADARLDHSALRRLTATAVRMLDNTIDVSKYALPEQHDMAQAQRRIGLGVTGVADAIAMLGTKYGSPKAAFLLGSWMQLIQNEAYRASALLAAERGSFPMYNAERHQENAMVQALDTDVQALISAHGLRNATLTTIAPTGTISMLAGNVSSGIEPIFSTSFLRTITNPDGSKSMERVTDYAVWRYGQIAGPNAPLPDVFVTAADLSPEDHVNMQAAAQMWVDSGISKTVNCPEDIPFEDFKGVYQAAYDRGCKGCTTYRPNAVTGAVLST